MNSRHVLYLTPSKKKQYSSYIHNNNFGDTNNYNDCNTVI